MAKYLSFLVFSCGFKLCVSVRLCFRVQRTPLFMPFTFRHRNRNRNRKFPLGETFFSNVQICASCLTKRSPCRLLKPLVYLLDRDHPRYVADCHLWPVLPRQPIRRPKLATLLAHLVSAISLACVDAPRNNLVLPFVKTFLERMQCSAP